MMRQWSRLSATLAAHECRGKVTLIDACLPRQRSHVRPDRTPLICFSMLAGLYKITTLRFNVSCLSRLIRLPFEPIDSLPGQTFMSVSRIAKEEQSSHSRLTVSFFQLSVTALQWWDVGCLGGI